jgi:hypothetical protein
MADLVKCNCAAVPPTMPTCRIDHLPTCPVAVYAAGAREGKAALITDLTRALDLLRRREEPSDG